MLDQWIINNADALQVILDFTVFGIFAVAVRAPSTFNRPDTGKESS